MSSRQVALQGSSSGPPNQDDQEEAQRRANESREENLFSGVFTTSRPSHVVSGLASGTWNMTKGVVLGAGSLVAGPCAGYQKDGVKGLLSGLGQGVVAAVVLPVAGVVTGVQQVGMGAMNTADYIKNRNDNKVYDEKQQAWVDKYRVLDEEYLESQEAYRKFQEERKKKSPKGAKLTRRDSQPRAVADTEYYDVLQVPTDATQSEIRKAYYKLARECHPDKRKDDPNAKDKFQKVGEAYQVLGDETRRDQYDKHGKSATEAMDFVDSSVFFAMLFGSEALEPYIGKLKLACVLDADGDQEPDILSAIDGDTTEQHYRQCHLAAQLRDRLQPGVEGLKSPTNHISFVEWKTNQRKIADALCKESFGAPLVDSVGFVYENYANHFLGTILGRGEAKIRNQTRQMANLFTAIQAATRVAKTSRKAQKAARKREVNQAESSGSNLPDDKMSDEEIKAMENSLSDIMTTMLQLCLADLNTTVRAAARKTINDRGVEADERRMRAEALRDLGKIFQEAAKAYTDVNKPIAPREQMEDAFIKMAQKMDEQRYEKNPSDPSR